uniref:DUF1618 domain-containing protein n=1 Tax=Oryza glumipatula TaxID=40148 RepID=A0A0D9YIY8_9ORYZ
MSSHGGGGGGGGGKRRLYMVLDDSKHGYGFRRIDMDEYYFEADDSGDDSALERMTEYLPSRRCLRVKAPRRQAMLFKALGTKIIATHPSPTCAAIPAYDTRAQAVSAGPAWPPGEGDSTLPSCSTVFVPVGDRLYALDGGGDSGRAVSFQVLFPSGGDGWWSWSSVASAAPPPFDPSRITSYAAHPNGRAFFVSVARKDVPFFPALSRGWLWLHAGSTFCFDTESLEWTDYGCWMLPFQGQGLYDAELDAWVGICRHPDKPGRLCSSDVPAPRIRGRDSRWRVPSCKIGKDVLFCKDKERHRGVALQYMGSDSNFCLLECVEQPAATASRLMYVRMFRLKYGKDGGLRTATRGRWGRCFLLPPEASSFDVMDQKITAFLMCKT